MFENLSAQSGLSLERLKTFREIVAAGGITAAAGDDSNRQSQFSRQLKELERYFGVELLRRALKTRGQALIVDCSGVLPLHHRAEATERIRTASAGVTII